MSLVGFRLRAERLRLPVLVLVVALLTVSTGSAVLKEFGDAAQRADLLQLALATPALLVFRGTPSGSSAGGIVWYQLFTWLAVVVGLANTFLATRYGRAEEERGAREALLALPVRRSAPVESTVVVGLVLNAATAVLAAVALIACRLPVAGSMLAGACFGVTGLAFLGVGLLANELAPTGRGANAVGGAVVGAAYALRAAGDALGTPHPAAGTLTPAWPVWLSPIGWAEEVQPYTTAAVGLLVPGLLLAAIGIAVALLRANHRDLGSSALPSRSGPARGGLLLRSAPGLDWRLDRWAVGGWSFAALVLGAVVPSLAHSAAAGFSGNAAIRAALRSFAPNDGGSLERITVDGVLGIVGVLAVAAAIQAVLRVRSEEASGRTELLLAASPGRVAWFGRGVLAGAVAAACVLTASAVAVLAASVSRSGGAEAWRRALQQLAAMPVALLAVAITALAVAAVPRAAAALVWTLYGVAVVIGLFGGLLDLPDAVLHASPFAAVPEVPVHDWVPTVVVLVVAAAAAALTLLAARRRQLTP